MGDNWDSVSCPPPTSLRCEALSQGRDVDEASAEGRAHVERATARMLFMPGTEQSDSRRAEVLITTRASEEALVMNLEYQIPKGWNVTSISDSGAWDQRHRKVKWGPFFENLSRTVTLTVTCPAGKVESDGFAGDVWLDGVGYRITVDLRR